jgi:predicted MFS family arabinose efflux permease
MVPLTLFHSRSFSGANLLTLFLYSALGIFFFLFPMNLIQVQGYSTTATGAAALPVILLMFSLSRWSGGLVTRYGPRAPLVIGPLIAAAGFVLFAMPGVGASYWNSFFPAFVVLGLGMAISVAPLTTVVMSSVDQNRTGVASGVNNAVARVAGVLAIAILGTVVVRLFSYSLNRSLTNALLPPAMLRYVQSNEVKLAGMDLPSRLDAHTTVLIRAAISHAFVFGFRVVMLACAGLSLASAAVASLIIPAKTQSVQKAQGAEQLHHGIRASPQESQALHVKRVFQRIGATEGIAGPPCRDSMLPISSGWRSRWRLLWGLGFTWLRKTLRCGILPKSSRNV